MKRDKLLILCYHGFGSYDEFLFRPKLFISEDTFQRRLEVIEKLKSKVLHLNDALDKLQRQLLPKNALVITIDDGFANVFTAAYRLLKSYQYPATVYVTSYYVQKETPVFRLVVQYMFWKTNIKNLHLKNVVWVNEGEVDLANKNSCIRLMWECIDYGEKYCTNEQREEICFELGRLLQIDYQKIKSRRFLSLMTRDEIRALAADGLIDVQLHTHRHRFPIDNEFIAKKEILDNKQILEAIIERPLVHFCYPSGIYRQNQWYWLEEIGIRSATTCNPGFNDLKVSQLGLLRFLDGENISAIEFKAELYGFMELLRKIGRRLKSFFE